MQREKLIEVLKRLRQVKANRDEGMASHIGAVYQPDPGLPPIGSFTEDTGNAVAFALSVTMDDDEESIDVDWLNSVLKPEGDTLWPMGVSLQGCDLCSVRVASLDHDVFVLEAVTHDEGKKPKWALGCCLHLKDRGHLRRLAREFSVPLKEGGAA